MTDRVLSYRDKMYDSLKRSASVNPFPATSVFVCAKAAQHRATNDTCRHNNFGTIVFFLFLLGIGHPVGKGLMDASFSFFIISNFDHLFSCLRMSCCPGITLLICVECTFGYCMYACVSIGRFWLCLV